MQNKKNIGFFSVDASHIGDLLALQATALEAMANAVAITDPTGTVIWVNSAFEQLTGYTCAEIVGQSTRLLKSGRNSRTLYEEMWRTILEGRIWRGGLINRRKDGSLYDEEMTITPRRNNRGEITHFVAIKQDITDRKRAEERLSLLSQAMENTSEFIGLGDTNANITFANHA